MEALVIIFIYLWHLFIYCVVAVLNHILVFDSFVVALLTCVWLHMERGWGLVAVWLLGIAIFAALVGLSMLKISAIIISVLATVFWTCSLEEIWRMLFYSWSESFGCDQLVVWSIIFLLINIGAHIVSYKRLKLASTTEQ